MPMLSFELKSCSESIAFTPALKPVRVNIYVFELVVLGIIGSVTKRPFTK